MGGGLDKPVIFLDIDGVLNTERTTERMRGILGIDSELVQNFKQILSVVDVDIVLSSTWRLYPDLKEAVEKIFTIRDVTPVTDGSRGDDIAAWLNDNPGYWDNHLVIDDDDDMVDGLTVVLVNPDFGLSLIDVQISISYLESKVNVWD